LELCDGEASVIDVDHASGLISRVAVDFESFLNLLHPSNESPP
jgi:hypothetical protein